AWSSFVTEITKYERSKYDGYLFGWGVVSGDPDQLIADHFHSRSARRTMYGNPEGDRLIAETREKFDDARARAASRRVQEIAWDGAPWFFRYEQPDINAINRKLGWSAGRREESLLCGAATLDA